MVEMGIPSVSVKHPALVEFLRRESLDRNGPFRLASGKTSDYYLDAKLTGLDPQGISLIVEAIDEEVRDIEFDAIGGLELGSTPIVGAYAYRSQQEGRPVPAFVVRKEKKAHGTMKQIEGPLPKEPCNVVVVDDVVTSGDSILQAIRVVKSKGHSVVLAISVVDRENGGVELLRRQNIPYQPLVTASELGIRDGFDQKGC